MRKLALALALAVAAAIPGTSGAAQPSAVREEEAFASWSVPGKDRNHFTWYFAYGLRQLEPAGDTWTAAGVGKGHCIRMRSRRSVSISCEGRGGPLTVDPASFTIDPAGRTAAMAFVKKGRRYAATWTERKRPHFGMYSTQIGCDGLGGAGGGIVWEPKATARMYGKVLKPKYWWDFAYTMSGGYVMECDPRLVERLVAGRSVEVTFTR